MAVIEVAPGELSAAYSSAVNDDELVLGPGDHPDMASGGFFSWGKRLIMRAHDWTVGMMVTGGTAHLYSGVTTRLKGRFSFLSGSSGGLWAGFAWSGAVSTATSGTALVRGSVGMEFQDLRMHNRETANGWPGRIFITFGAPELCQNIAVRRCRFRDCGDATRNNHDHFIYAKNVTGLIVEDCIFYDLYDGWCLHLYNNCDGGIFRRLLMYKPNGGIVYSGADDPSTGLTGCQHSDSNTLQDSILFDAQRSGRYLIEANWGCDPGTGNIAQNSLVRDGLGAGGRILQASGQPSLTNISDTGDPVFADPANGDFTLVEGSPGVGYGPTQIQPSGAGTVAREQIILWNTRARVEKTRVLPWNVRQAIARQQSLLWDVLSGQQVAAERTLLWDVLPAPEKVEKQATLLWRVVAATLPPAAPQRRAEVVPRRARAVVASGARPAYGLVARKGFVGDFIEFEVRPGRVPSFFELRVYYMGRLTSIYRGRTTKEIIRDWRRQERFGTNIVDFAVDDLMKAPLEDLSKHRLRRGRKAGVPIGTG